MSFSITSSSFLHLYQQHRHQPHSFTSLPNLTSHSHSLIKSPLRLHATRRTSNGLVDDPTNWGRSINSGFMPDGENGDDDDDDEEEEEDRRLDLLVRFVANVFKKTSKRARKAVRSVLPVPISTKLVEFSVNGVLVLAFLWVLKAFLEAAGITKHISNITPCDAEDALQHLKDRLTSLESEVRDLTLKNRISSERSRLWELIPQTSTDENCQSPRRVQSPFLSALDR